MARLFPSYELVKHIGAASIEVPGATIKEVLDNATRRYGQAFMQSDKGISYLINGRNINFIKGFKSPVTDADTIHMVKASGGG